MVSREVLVMQFNGTTWEITLVHWSDKYLIRYVAP
jgi:hypothetical protein